MMNFSPPFQSLSESIIISIFKTTIKKIFFIKDNNYLKEKSKLSLFLTVE